MPAGQANKNILIHSGYLPSVSQFVLWFDSDIILLDHFSPFKKSTGRNRCLLASSNGLLQLSVPLQGGRNIKDAMREVLVAENEPWKHVHWGSVFSNYGKSAYFHFYEDAFREVFFRQTEYLAGWNYSLLLLCMEWLGWKTSVIAIGAEEELKSREFTDLREVKSDFNLNPYHQVFDAKTGFIQPVSIVDLVFNLGPSANEYLFSSKNKNLSG